MTLDLSPSFIYINTIGEDSLKGRVQYLAQFLRFLQQLRILALTDLVCCKNASKIPYRSLKDVEGLLSVGCESVLVGQPRQSMITPSKRGTFHKGSTSATRDRDLGRRAESTHW
jgi:hypothetical protein